MIVINAYLRSNATGGTGAGCLIYQSADTTIAGGGGIATWDSEAYDTTGWHSPTVDPTQIKIGGGVTLVQLAGNIQFNSLATSEALTYKNGAAVYGMGAQNCNVGIANCSSAILEVVAADYFELRASAGAGSDTTDASEATWFSLATVDTSIKRALARKSANQSLAAATVTTMTFETDVYDTDAIHDPLSATVTMTIASPCVVTWTGHNFLNGSPIVLTTTGALPTGLTAGTTYYAVSVAANTFRLAATPGGTAINTSGSQSGVHTGTNTSRFVAPATGNYRVGSNLLTGNAGQAALIFLKNGSSAVRGLPLKDCTATSAGTAANAWSAVIALTAGDYIEFQGYNESASNAVGSEYTWGAMESVPSGRKFAVIYKSANQSITGGAGLTAVVLGGTLTDADSLKSGNTIVGPSGYSKARASFGLITPSTANAMQACARLNGADYVGAPDFRSDTTTTDSLSGVGAWVAVNPAGGDAFSLYFASTTSLTLADNNSTWFCVEFEV